MTEFSQPAQAILDAYYQCPVDFNFLQDDRNAIASVLCALADQVVPANGSRKNNEIREEILSIANELRTIHFEA
jgi:hypothetical protein